MDEKELKKLSRADLLNLLVEMSEERDRLRTELAEAKKKLNERELVLNSAGSIAEAALRINELFTVAQSTADQYLASVANLKERQEAELAKDKETAQQELAAMRQEGERIRMRAESDAQIRMSEARRESESYWQEISGRLENFYTEHQNLREMLALLGRESGNAGQSTGNKGGA